MHDVVVVGGGLAGAAAALRLAKAGREVVVLERERAPKPKVCGEFLAAPALTELRALGVDAAALGGVPLHRVTLSSRRSKATAGLPFRAMSLSRRILDAHLLEEASAAGADVRAGARVTGVERQSAGFIVRMGSLALSARDVIIASGKWDVRGHPRGRGRQNALAGLKATVALTQSGRAALAGSVDLILCGGGYCGVAESGGGEATVSLVVPRARLAAGETPAEVMAAAAVGSRAEAILQGATLTGPMAAIGTIPYGAVRRAAHGPYYVGDQAAVIPSFCGEGMGLALASARLAAEAILAGVDAATTQRAFARLAAPRVHVATTVSRALCTAPGAEVAIAIAALSPRLARTLAGALRTPVPRLG